MSLIIYGGSKNETSFGNGVLSVTDEPHTNISHSSCHAHNSNSNDLTSSGTDPLKKKVG